MMTDPIADMLTRIRNASLVHKKEVVLPFSKIKMAIAKILVREGYLASAEEVKEVHPAILLKLKYVSGMPVVQSLKRISTPGHRRYVGKEDIQKILNGLGFAIISTPQGLLTDREAMAANVGGEVICEVY